MRDANVIYCRDPARYQSTRLPGKPLADIVGKPMIQFVYEQAMQAGADRVIIATDDERVEQAVQAFGGGVYDFAESSFWHRTSGGSGGENGDSRRSHCGECAG